MNRMKFIIGGLAILGAVIFLGINAMKAGAEYFYTIDELYSQGQSVVGKPLRISGAVIGDTIQYDPETLTLTFTVAHIPADNQLLEEEGGLAEALHAAVTDSTRNRLQVVYIGPKPDLLQDEAQAIMTGKLDENGVFQAEELLLKCPTRYEGAVPDQAGN
jgi:cytochrome c-type biogenesis protein CcmE